MEIPKKKFLSHKTWSYIIFTGCILANIGIGGALIGFRYGCMKNDTNSFASNYCTSDSNARAVVNALLTLMIFVLGFALGDAVCAYRTLQLSKGINEGVYVAMGSSNIKYRWKSLFTKKWWCFVILTIMVFQYLPGSLNTISNLVIKTVPVYVENKSQASVYNATSFYNATQVMFDPDIAHSIEIIGQLRGYSSGSNSRLNNGKVTTNIIRSQFVPGVDIIDGDETNSFRYSDTIASATTSCTSYIVTGLFNNFFTKTSVSMNFTDLDTDTFGGVVYDLHYIVYNNTIVFYSNIYIVIQCNTCKGDDILSYVVETFESNCTTYVVLKEQEIIYTIATKNIQQTKTINETTTVDLNNLGQLVANYCISIEGTGSEIPDYSLAILGDLISNFDSGLFNDSSHNYLHSKISGSVSLSLNDLWNNYQITTENNYSVNEAFINISNSVLQAYLSPGPVWAFVVVLITATCFLCIIGIVSSCKSVINIKNAVENSLLDSITTDVIEDRRKHNASNDPDEQLKLSFNNTLYSKKRENNGKFYIEISYKQPE